MLKVVWKSWGVPSYLLPLSLIPSLSLPPPPELGWSWAKSWGRGPALRYVKPCLWLITLHWVVLVDWLTDWMAVLFSAQLAMLSSSSWRPAWQPLCTRTASKSSRSPETSRLEYRLSSRRRSFSRTKITPTPRRISSKYEQPAVLELLGFCS